MKLYKFINLIFLSIILLSSTSCDDWLTVLPETKVHSDKLLSDQKGYQDAVIGLYLKLGSKELYGQELTMKTPDILAQYYAFSVEDELFDVVNYDFEKTSTDNTITNIWSSFYNLIANCNNILTQLEEADDDIFTGNVKDVLMYQVLTIRALAHFDLFRLFHAPYIANQDFLGIPYVKDLSLELTEQSTSEQIVGFILDDLQKAYNLSKTLDPIFPNNPQQDFEYMKEKTLYVNHYAIAGLLARVYLYVNNNELALKYAKEILDENKFTLTHAQDVIPEKDFAFFDEVLLGVFTSKIDEYTRLGIFKTDTEIMKGLPIADLTNFYAPDDIRLIHWFGVGGSAWYPHSVVKKYNRTDKESELSTFKKPPMVPILKIGEIMLIEAEATAKLSTVSDGLQILNDLQSLRTGKISEAGDMIDFMKEIEDEYRREFYGEGQMFYMLKRINKQNVNFRNLNVEMNASNNFLPLPKNEVQFGGRKTN